ncbi:hypothetical protein SCHPADRAFT_275443 [Schizopora paradoxa]|uniref:F-box domain-containing protein n=1 Tax=Schizopora paradoxa TaxID=27342 RepID=A0A0H2RUM3_9AGAM|nr:hypothetical protein SCHPADRAFT_275443 [Schizopora paradoxa]
MLVSRFTSTRDCAALAGHRSLFSLNQHDYGHDLDLNLDLLLDHGHVQHVAILPITNVKSISLLKRQITMPARKHVKPAGTEPGDTTPVATGRGKRGTNRRKPALVIGLPNEIFAEVAKYLSPDDLLRLSRTSKHSRDILMSKTSKHIWVASRKTLNVPDCPPDLSEPQYADLIFGLGKGCSFCPNRRTQKEAFFHLRVRMCKGCQKTHFIQTSELKKSLPSSLPSDVSEVLDLLPDVTLYVGIFLEHFVLKPQADAVLQKMQALPPNSEEREAFVKERRDRADIVSKLNKQVYEWERTMSTEKRDAKLRVLRERELNIYTKLTALGYGDEDIDHTLDKKGWNWIGIFRKNRPLTEKEWEAIEPKLIETIRLRRDVLAPQFLEHRRGVREMEIRGRYMWFLFMSPKAKELVLPREDDLLELQVVKELIEENECRIRMTDERWQIVEKYLCEVYSQPSEEKGAKDGTGGISGRENRMRENARIGLNI